MDENRCDEKKSCQVCDKDETCGRERKDDHAQELLRQRMSSIKYTCMVMSGKGGVGKSSVATNLAVTLAMEGYTVGLVDADIHGPNIPKMLGIEDERPSVSEQGLAPVSSAYGLKVMSIGFFSSQKTMPAVIHAFKKIAENWIQLLEGQSAPLYNEKAHL